MKNVSGGFLLFLAKVFLIAVILTLFLIGQILFYEQTTYYFWGNIAVLFLYAASLYLVSRVYNGFAFGNASFSEIILSWVLSLLVTNAFQFLILSLIADGLLPVYGFLIILLAQITFIIPLAFLLNKLYYRQNPARNAIIVYGKKDKLDEFCSIVMMQRMRFRVNHIVSQDTDTGALLDFVDAAESVFFLDVDESKQDWILEYCYMHNKHAYIQPTFSKILINTAGTFWLSNAPVFSLKTPLPDVGTLFIKRLMDIVISLISIILTSWLMIGIWFIVRSYDRHPAIYKQTRVTRGGKQFTLYKFRSMRPDSEDDGVPRLTQADDDRITPIGHFIRRTRIDELPQLFNVLRGAMSIVGPRPERPEIARQYEEIYPNFSFRTKVKAGITGFAQIHGRYNTAPDEKLFLDIMYIETFSILQDIKLMLQTVSVLFKGSSTEGVDDGLTTALWKGDEE
ncbi:MAG: exopolysaccharide biosynthesis polyprenyl glycosylphosphotransferase [Oscillospiraceae bacterium]|nr:exopolysaccharide biosynthesis polyprenyl glycosylphosphotransferase [Oscillospiraceae bacterium]MCL2278577.1 exopolysaccharide biosynthesis polyprenyl glycosylphosphotransferase [Oscillospiraceae bacterium]